MSFTQLPTLRSDTVGLCVAIPSTTSTAIITSKITRLRPRRFFAALGGGITGPGENAPPWPGAAHVGGPGGPGGVAPHDGGAGGAGAAGGVAPHDGGAGGAAGGAGLGAPHAVAS